MTKKAHNKTNMNETIEERKRGGKKFQHSEQNETRTGWREERKRGRKHDYYKRDNNVNKKKKTSKTRRKKRYYSKKKTTRKKQKNEKRERKQHQHNERYKISARRKRDQDGRSNINSVSPPTTGTKVFLEITSHGNATNNNPKPVSKEKYTKEGPPIPSAGLERETRWDGWRLATERCTLAPAKTDARLYPPQSRTYPIETQQTSLERNSSRLASKEGALQNQNRPLQSQKM